MTNKIVLVGGGGHCKACIDVIETTNFEISGIIDNDIDNRHVLNYRIIGNDDGLKELAKSGHFFLVTVGQVKDPEPRVKLFRKIKEANGMLARVIAGSALISKYSSIGEGTIAMHQSIINSSTKIGDNCIINNKALIEHDCIIGDHTHISTGSIVNGGCTIGSRVFIGSNSVIAQEVQVADNVVIGAGSVVIKDITEGGIFAGNPVKRIDE